MIRRTFTSQAEFDAWHEQAKTTLGLPIVGRNARTGEPEPDKQQTVAYTDLMRDENGNIILEATIGDPSLAARGLVAPLVDNGLLTAQERTEIAKLIPAWEAGRRYKAGQDFKVGDLTRHTGVVYRCLRDHTADASSTPGTSPTLWAEEF